ncbi:outer membrane lipoprotein [Sporomusa ovata DSM 2662]|uniref:Gene Transfer Agent NlpC/P60 family peptidase \|nr:NlpC/P60 family protein [Sporomusa ovata]EQB24709.1 putative phage cell wall peptidase, NlpC/P60 family [Sporomusa ovata DSM 2662]CQR75054.1 Gene Transfer Agent NlpC/P60 family peptidase \
MIGEKIVVEAREWVGTKWQHQASLKGVATDCVGLIRGVYTTVTGRPVESDTDYHRMPVPGREKRLQEELSNYAAMVEIANRQPGDVLLFSFSNGTSNHVGIYAGEDRFIHAWADVHKVVEMPLSPAWLRSLRNVFRIPEAD